MRDYAISLFLPVYNFPADRLVSNVKKIHAFLKENYRQFEIIIVDDNSSSATTKGFPKISKLARVLTYKNGPSRRENLAASFKKAKHQIVCFMDIDLATDMTYLPKITDPVSKGYDIATGSRHTGIVAKREGYRSAISKVYNLALRILFGSKVLDHTCGFKALKKEAAAKVIGKMGYDKDQKRGWFWDAEMLIRSQKMGLKVIEVPVVWRADKETTFSWKREFKLVPYLLKFWMGK